MHLAQRAYVLIVLTALLAVAGLWSSEPALAGWWRLPAGLLLLGLALEGAFISRARITATIETASAAFLGREQPAAFAFRNEASRALSIQYAPALPQGFEQQSHIKRVVAPAGGVGRDAFSLVPVRLGAQPWVAIPARILGPLALAWWSRQLHPGGEITVAPDTLRTAHARVWGSAGGHRPRRVAGAGSELHQLRPYRQGDPLSRIDWKATARTRQLVTREFSEDQHLDIFVAIDAGRFSRVRAGTLDRLGLYANVAARFAEIVTPLDDRIGLMVFSDRPLVVCPPARGVAAVAGMRRALARMTPRPAESDPIAAAIRIRSVLTHRSLIVMLTDLDDANVADQLARAVRLLSPPHLVVIAGVLSSQITEFTHHEAQTWSDPWVALAAEEHQTRATLQRARLRRLGAPVIASTEDQLENDVLREYQSLRRARRI